MTTTMHNSRRTFLKASMIGVGASLTQLAQASSLPTPSEIEGPFYPVVAQKDTDFDLTHIQGHSSSAQGQHIFIEGRVIDTRGNPIENASIDLWQANAAGKYRHPHDTSDAPLDPDFQGWALLRSGHHGEFKLKTVMPGAYPVFSGWTRPPHIHFKVSKRGYEELVTQMYFANQVLNDSDKLLMKKSADEQDKMIAKLAANNPHVYNYTLVLEAV